MRQLISGPLESTNFQQRTDEGWKLTALEWEREVEIADNQLSDEVPFGLRIAPEGQRLEQNLAEREILLQLMELIVQEGSMRTLRTKLIVGESAREKGKSGLLYQFSNCCLA